MEIITWLFLIAFAFGCSYWGGIKGYSKWVWFFAGSFVGLIVIACLPKVSDLEESKRDKQINLGNTIGIIMAVASFTWGFAQGLMK
jgi:hypothetical protein